MLVLLIEHHQYLIIIFSMKSNIQATDSKEKIKSFVLNIPYHWIWWILIDKINWMKPDLFNNEVNWVWSYRTNDELIIFKSITRIHFVSLIYCNSYIHFVSLIYWTSLIVLRSLWQDYRKITPHKASNEISRNIYGSQNTDKMKLICQ